MIKFYTGIGSRNTPDTVQQIEQLLAAHLEGRGYCLRSGGATGSDSAFERGVTAAEHKEIYIPWSGFNDYTAGPGIIDTTALENRNRAAEIAMTVHPAWDRLTRGARALHTRNVYQVLGFDLNTHSRFVVCWAEYQGNRHNAVKGGTNTAVQLALQHNIPVINLFGAPSYEAVLEKLAPHLD